jgi:hypothetical protein
MPREDRLRRVVILCRTFAQALAYYRVQRSEDYRWLFDSAKTGSAGAKFWSAVNGALFDSCVLDWCKLFGDPKAHHYWGNVVTDPRGFETELLAHLGLDKASFHKEIEVMREYRDKWLAHLDSELRGKWPHLDVPKKAVWFYHAYVVNSEAHPNDPKDDLAGLPADLEPEYRATEDDAKAVYRRFTK